MVQIHATAISIDGNAVLLRGAPGSGKSDLALRLLDDGAELIADDRCDINVEGDDVIVSCPEEITGLVEIRGIGIARLAYGEPAPIALVIDLVTPEKMERLPEPATCDDFGPSVAHIRLTPFEVSASLKLRAALHAALGSLEIVP